jgi:hypothetical protein
MVSQSKEINIPDVKEQGILGLRGRERIIHMRKKIVIGS